MSLFHLAKFCIFILSISTSGAVAAPVKVIGNINAKVVKTKIDISSNNQDLTYEVPLSALNVGDNYNPINLNLSSKDKDISYRFSSESNSVINVFIDSKDKKPLGNADAIYVDLKNSEGEVIRARIKAEDTKIISDKDGHAKIQLKIEIPPEKIKSKGAYKATYYIVLQH